MNQPPSAILTANQATGAARLHPWARVLLACLAGSALIAACAHIAVPLPWTPVPMTMQPFAVLLLALVLGPALGAAAILAYLAEAAVGLPVLVPGFGALLPPGPSEGYLLSYPLVALVAGSLYRGRGIARALLAASAGEVVILALGTLWLATFAHLHLHAALSLGVAPFLAGDAVKVLLAAALAAGCTRWRHAQARPV